ncbi:hypothetical protein [Marivita sp.]|uniref:hypothetical protein n=1 Tax=Marivita sp. TaxID=2003365 RepID=UPI003F70F0E4
MSYHYDINRTWSDQFIPEIKRIVGAELLKVASNTLDQTQATDLVMLDAQDMRIAARVRRPGYAERYPHQFTIRSGLPSGAPTELNKIVNGYGDLMFYGHSDEFGRLDSWWLIDLRAFRAALIRRADIRYGTQKNFDGTCFTWFDVRSFPNNPPLVLLASR